MKNIKTFKNNLSKHSHITRELNLDYCEKKNSDNYDLNKLKIIGITGSTGKSTTAYIIHKYLQLIGKKSVLYSSIMVDNPASLIPSNAGYEVACKSEDALLSILNETEYYGAEYLVLEINESTIEKNFIKDLPFTVRVLTNILPVHNLERYTREEYINLKKSFFTDINDNSICIFGFQNYTKELLDELLEINKNRNTIVCTNKYIKDLYNISSVDNLLYECKNSINGMELKIKTNDEDLFIKTNVCMFHNAMNILTSLSVIKGLSLFNKESFSKLLSNITIPGRTEIIRTNGRYIIIDSHLPKVLENLQEYKDNGEINRINVVMSSIGSGFRSWDRRYKSIDYIDKHKLAKKYAVELVSRYADTVYFTESDSAKENPLDICLELKSYLDSNILSKVIVNREDAIKDAIVNSNKKDAIFISGRGNRSIMCISETKVRHIKDSDIVKRVINELGWTIDE